MRAATCWALLLSLAACTPTPSGEDRLDAADHAAVRARLHDADEALRAERFAAAETALLHALSRASDAEQIEIRARLAAEDLTLGLRWERALAGGDPPSILALAGEIAGGTTPLAAEARRRLEADKPRALIEALRSACGEAHRGSCTAARSALVAEGFTTPEAREAVTLADAEAQRIAPILTRAEGYLRIFAAEGKKKKVLERCLNARITDTPDQGQLHETCEEEAYGSDPPEEIYQRRRSNEALFRRALTAIADDAITRALRERRTQALAEGTLELPPALRAARRP